MQITITRTGGFAGLRRQWVVAVDDATAASVLRAMTDDGADGTSSDGAGAASSDGAAGPRAADAADRDRFTYVFTAGSQRIRIGESHLHGPWRDLLDRAEPQRPA